MKKTLVAALLAACSGAAFAAAPAFEQVDTNKDGMISAEEAAVVEGLNFTDADDNSDGKLDANEYAEATKG